MREVNGSWVVIVDVMKEKEALIKLRIKGNETLVLAMRHSLSALKGC
jgi:hypothetical protein